MKTIKDYRIAFWSTVVKAFNNEAKNSVYYASQPSESGFSVTDQERTVVIAIYTDPDSWQDRFAILDGSYKLIGYLDQRNDAKMIAQNLWKRLSQSKRANVPSRYLK